MNTKDRSVPINLGTPSDKLYRNTGLNIGAKYLPTINNDWLEPYYYSHMGMRATVIAGTWNHIGVERITSTTNGPNTFNTCYHEVTRGFNYPCGWALRAANYSSGYARPYYRSAMPAYTGNTARLSDLAGLDVDNARARAYYTMQPRFAQEFSLLNALFELKDFRDLAKVLTNRNFMASKTVKWLKSFRSSPALKKILKLDPTAPAASLLLADTLALKPLIKDIYSVLEKLQYTAMQAQSMFALSGLDDQSNHYSETSVFSDTRQVPYGDYVWMTNGDYYSAKFTATMHYTFTYNLQPLFSAAERYWGLNMSFEAIWNATPFSFLLDYIIKIGDGLHAMERDPNVNDFLIKSYGESIKVSYKRGQFWRYDARLLAAICNGVRLNLDNSINSILMAGYESKIYYRYPSTPYKGLYVPRLKIPSAIQKLNVLALARLLLF